VCAHIHVSQAHCGLGTRQAQQARLQSPAPAPARLFASPAQQPAPAPVHLPAPEEVKANEPRDEVLCPMDYVPVRDGRPVHALPCSHVFHEDCIFSWIRFRKHDASCPNCRATIPPELITEVLGEPAEDVHEEDA
jgi:hypothetical protein